MLIDRKTHGGRPRRFRPVRPGAARSGLGPRMQQNATKNGGTVGALFISTRTAQTHVQHIFAKLGVDSRAKAVAFALQHLLV